MIFVVVGTQLPFDRLVHGVDRWAALRGRQDVVAQVGPTRHPPSFVRWRAFYPLDEFRQSFDSATVIVAHAGMGAIIRAIEQAKPILIMPRRADLGEHRNDHQLATARAFDGRPGVLTAQSEIDLQIQLDTLTTMPIDSAVPRDVSAQLVHTLFQFIQNHTVK